MSETPNAGGAAAPRSNATSVVLAIVAPLALLMSFVPYFLGGLTAVYDDHAGSDRGGFAGYGYTALVLGLGFPAWALVWGIVDVHRTKRIPGGAAIVLGAFSLGVALCVILPGSVTIIAKSASLSAAYERAHPPRGALDDAEARNSREAESAEGRAAERAAPAARAAAKQRLDSLSEAVLTALDITPEAALRLRQPTAPESAGAGAPRLRESSAGCEAGYGPQAGLQYFWTLTLDRSIDPAATEDAVRNAITSVAPDTEFTERTENANDHSLSFIDRSQTDEFTGEFSWGRSEGSDAPMISFAMDCR
ncbi:hypothetical protein ACLBWP_11450 [Microbacterium sp. M1A1_1b]